jgi:hypothetical protein
MSLFDKIADAKENDFGSYIRPGVWKMEIQACKEVKPRSGGEAFTVEGKVVETDCEGVRVGERVSWQCHSKHDSAPSNIRHFLAVAFNVPFEEVDGAGYQLVVSAENPLAGKVIYCLARNIKTRAGRDFTRVSWSLTPFTAGQIAKADADAKASESTPAAAAQ